VYTACTLVLVLSNLLVLSDRTVTLAVTLRPLDHVADPATDAFAVLGVSLGHVLVAALDVRRVDVESRNGLVLRAASADVERWNRRAAAFSAEK